jgi:sn-glycerol 3-phosphate transport system substrate-binding protein
MKSSRRWAALALVLALGSAACGGQSKRGGNGTGTTGTNKLASECGLAEFARATKPVDITFWEQNQTQVNADWLKETTAAFNASQHDVHVSLLQFPNYQDLLTKYLGGLSSGSLPDLFQPEDTTVQRLMDSRSTVPMQACVDADHYSLTDFLPRATAFYSYKNVLQGMPWTISNIVLWYNRTAFQKAGLDPNHPPATLAEVMADSRKIVQSGAAKYGIALRVEPYVFEFLNAKSGSTYVNHGNGRDARATASTINTPTALKIWTWWNEMVHSRLAVNTGGATGNIDHMLALGQGDAAMTMEASGVLGTVRKALESGQYHVKIGVGPLPSLNGDGGVPVGDGSLWIPKAAAPARRAAAWQFVKYLSSAKEQADLAASLGYVPVRTSATAVGELQQTWASDPIFKVAYDQLVSGPTNAATVGSLIGDYQGVRDAVRDGMLSMLTDGLSPQAALEKAQKEADTSIKAYNTRLGVG